MEIAFQLLFKNKNKKDKNTHLLEVNKRNDQHFGVGGTFLHVFLKY